jgi:secreted trypsin-like serine protease
VRTPLNGEELDDISDYLHVVTLVIEDNQFNQFICGGTLIDPRHVITSAHCLEKGFV